MYYVSVLYLLVAMIYASTSHLRWMSFAPSTPYNADNDQRFTEQREAFIFFTYEIGSLLGSFFLSFERTRMAGTRRSQ